MNAINRPENTSFSGENHNSSSITGVYDSTLPSVGVASQEPLAETIYDNLEDNSISGLVDETIAQREPGGHQSRTTESKVFGVPLEDISDLVQVLISKSTADGKNYAGDIPRIVAISGRYLKEVTGEMPETFLSNGSTKDASNKLRTIFDSPPDYGASFQFDESVTCSDVLMLLCLYLYELPHSLVPADVYQKMRNLLQSTEGSEDHDTRSHFQPLIQSLPKRNKDLLLYLLDLLHSIATRNGWESYITILATLFYRLVFHAARPKQENWEAVVDKNLLGYLIGNSELWLAGSDVEVGNLQEVARAPRNQGLEGGDVLPDVEQGSPGDADAQSVAMEDWDEPMDEPTTKEYTGFGPDVDSESEEENVKPADNNANLESGPSTSLSSSEGEESQSKDQRKPADRHDKKKDRKKEQAPAPAKPTTVGQNAHTQDDVPGCCHCIIQ